MLNNLQKNSAIKTDANSFFFFWNKTYGSTLPFFDSIFVIRLSGFPVKFCLCAKAEADAADAVEKQQLVGVDSAWSFLTSTWVLQSSIPCVESVWLDPAHPWRPSICPPTQFPWQRAVCCVHQTQKKTNFKNTTRKVLDFCLKHITLTSIYCQKHHSKTFLQF